MKILLTNDDSVSASQLLPLIRWAKKWAEVEVFVPKFEQSGKSHGIELRHSFEVAQVALAEDVTVTTVDSTPADCVRYALMGAKVRPDLVISGINRGYNMGKDIMYSGTVAAIFEASAQGVPGIALSTSPGYYDQAAQHLDRIFAFIEAHKLLQQHDLYNINIPPQAGAIRITQQGGPFYSDDFTPQEGNMVLPTGRCIFVPSDDMTLDTNAVTSGYISISPLTTNRTDLKVYHQLLPLSE